MIEYGDEDLLMLSGIQHITFCKRQWALIHIEQQWAENNLTIEGNWMHQKVDDPTLMNRNKGIVTLRSVTLVSRRLGLYGISDVVEMVASTSGQNSIRHPILFTSYAFLSHPNLFINIFYPGFWQLIPVEYKRGKPKKDQIDEVQLCAQAICLEEMYNVSIEKGFLYYGETRHREEVQFTEKLRKLVENKCVQMHKLYEQKVLPPAIYKAHCKSCSLCDVCMPKVLTKTPKVNTYLSQLYD